ncbi:MAG: MFS transporter [Propionibacteriales bacterium]|nr:MFS transporter [Propionibacteriales bacterium]
MTRDTADVTVRTDAGSPIHGVAAVVAAVGIMLVAANLRPPVVAVGPLIDVISADLGFSSGTAGLLTTIPVLFFGLSAPFAARLAARFGIERTILGALLVLIGAILLRLIVAPWALLLGSALLGMAIGVCNVVLPSLIKRDFAHRSGLMTGLYSMTLSGGAAVASGLTIPIYEAAGGNWHITLASWVLLTVVAVLVWLPQLRRTHTVHAGSLPRALRRDPIAWSITIYMGSQSLIFYTFSAWLTPFLLDRGRTAAYAGMLLAVGQVVGLILSFLAPILAGRFRDQRVIAFAFLAVCAIGLVGMVTTDQWTPLWVCAVFAGPGASVSMALLFMVLRSNSAAQTGQVSGMAQSFGYVLAAVGPILIGSVHDVVGSWRIAMAVLALAVIPQGLATMRAAKDVTMQR